MTKTQENGVTLPEFDFAQLRIEDSTAVFRMPWIGDGVELDVRPAMEFNSAYMARQIELPGRRDRIMRIARTGDVNKADEAADREDDRLSFGGTVVVGWRGVNDRHGEPAEFSPEACDAFLRALPDWIFDRLRLFAKVERSFCGGAAIVANPEALAGN